MIPLDVVPGGSRAMHAVEAIRCPGLTIESLDAPVVAVDERTPLCFTRNQPSLKGFHFCLFNNAWGTNYVQWFGEDMTFRFRIGVSA